MKKKSFIILFINRIYNYWPTTSSQILLKIFTGFREMIWCKKNTDYLIYRSTNNPYNPLPESLRKNWGHRIITLNSKYCLSQDIVIFLLNLLKQFLWVSNVKEFVFLRNLGVIINYFDTAIQHNMSYNL